MSEITPFQEWSPSSGPIVDPIEKRKQYSNYLRGEYLKNKEYSLELDQTIDESTVRALVEVEGPVIEARAAALDIPVQEEFEKILSPSPITFEDKLQIVGMVLGSGYLSTEGDESSALYEFTNFVDDDLEDTATRKQAKREAAESFVNKYYNKAARTAVAKDLTPYARVESEDGSITLIGGESAIGLDPYEAYKKSLDSGMIKGEDAKFIFAGQQKDELGYEFFRYENVSDALTVFSQVEDELIFDVMDSMAESMAETGELDEQDASFIIRQLHEQIPAAREIPEGDLLTALDYHVGSRSLKHTEYDEEDFTNNLSRFGLGQAVVHPQALENTKVFEETISGLSESEKERLRADREVFRDASFDEYSQVFARSYLAEEWEEAVAEGKLKNMTNGEILDDFTEKHDEESYGYFRNEVLGLVGNSIPESVTDIVWGIGAMNNNSYAREALLENERDRQAKRRFAQIMGENVGMGIDLSSMIAPVVVDVGATALITKATAGTGTAAYLGSRLTAKGLLNTAIKGSLRQGVGESLEGAAERVSRDLIRKVGVKKGVKKRNKLGRFMSAKEVAEEATTANAKTAIQTYTKMLHSKVPTVSSIFITAGTRSGTMTYASVYDALGKTEEGKALSDEERHQKALKTGLVAAVSTGAITSAFTLGGLGGLESYLMTRATVGEARRMFSVLAKGLSASDDLLTKSQFGQILGALTRKHAPKYFNAITIPRGATAAARGFRDEALEEGLDEYVNTLIQAAAGARDDLNFGELMAHTGTAAFYGGIFGAGMQTSRRIFSRISGATDADEVESRRLMGEQVRDDMVRRLEEVGSPETADAVGEKLQEIINKGEQVSADSAKGPKKSTEAEDPKTPTEPTEATEVPAEDAEVAAADEKTAAQQQQKLQEEEIAAQEQSEIDDFLFTIENNGVGFNQEVLDDVPKRVVKVVEGEPAEKVAKRTATKKAAKKQTAKKTAAKGKGGMKTKSLGNREYLITGLPQTWIVAKRSDAWMTFILPEGSEDTNDGEYHSSFETKKEAISWIKADAEETTAKKAAKKTAAKKAAKKKGKPEVSKKQKGEAVKKQSPENRGIAQFLINKEEGELGISEPVDSKEKASQQANNALQILSEKGFPHSINSGQYGFPRLTRPQIAEFKAKLKKNIKERYPVFTKEDVAKLYKIKDPKDIEVLKKGLKYQGTFLFNNDPKTIKALRDDGHEINTPEGIEKVKGYNKSIVVTDNKVDFVKGIDPLTGNPVILNKAARDKSSEITEVDRARSLLTEYLFEGLSREGVDAEVMETVVRDFNISGFYPKFTSDNKDIMEEIAKAEILEGALERGDFKTEEEYQKAVEEFQAAATQKSKILTKMAKDGLDFDGNQFVLHGPTKLKDAIPKIKKWINENYAGMAERNSPVGRKFATATKLSRIGRKGQVDAHHLFGKAAAKFYYELNLAVKVAGLRQMLIDGEFVEVNVSEEGEPVYSFKEGLFAEIDPTKTVGGDPESRIVKGRLGEEETDVTNAIMAAFPMERISKWFQTEMLEEGKSVHIGRTTTPETDLVLSSKTSKLQQLATFLYVTNRGKGNFGNATQEEMTSVRALEERNIAKGGSQYKLTKNWEHFVIKRALEKLINYSPYNPADKTSPFPNFLRAATRAGNSISEQVSKYVYNNPLVSAGELGVDQMADTASFQTQAEQDSEKAVEEPVAPEGGDNNYRDLPKEVGKLFSMSLQELEGLKGREREELLENLRFIGGRKTVPTGARISRELPDTIGSKTVESERRYKIVFKQLPDAVKAMFYVRGYNPPASEEARLEEYFGEARRIASKDNAPNWFQGLEIEAVVNRNQEDIERLGLVNGDPASVVVALKEISKSGVDESHRTIAKLLLKNQDVILGSEFLIKKDKDAQAGAFEVFTDGTSRVTLNTAGYYGSGVESIILHEYLHALTDKLLKTDRAKLTPKQRAAIQRLEGLRKIVQKEYTRSLELGGKEKLEVTYGLANMSEFISTMFTSSAFQNQVRTMPRRGLVQRFVDIVKDLVGLGKGTRLAQAFDDLVDFVNMDVAENLTPLAKLDTFIETYEFKRDSPEGKYISDFLENVGEAVTPDTTERLSSFSGLDTGATLDEEGQAQLLEILEQTVAQVIPSNVPVKLVSDITGTPLENDPEAAFMSTIVEEDGVGIPTMFINQANLESYLAETGGELFTPKLTKMLIESLLSEEFIHVAEFRTVSTEELDTIVDSLSDSTLAEIVSQYTAKSNNEGLRDRLNKGIAENDAIIKRQIVGEKLRMSAQKIMRGSTTEEDIAFYMGEPSFARILLRYLTNVFRKMYARYNLRKENPYMAAAINAMANELNLLRRGSFYQPTVSRFDVNNPNESLENLNQRLAATFAGDPDIEIDENTSLEDIYKRFSHLKVYEIADGVFEKKKYTPNKGLMRFLNGDTDRRVLELKLQSEAVSNGVTQKVISDAAIIMDLLEKNPDVTNDILADYLGRPDNLTPDDAVMEDLHNKHIRRIAIEKERRRRGETTEPIDYKALKNEYYDKPLEAYQKKVREGLIRKKDAAAAKIEKTKPKLYRALKNMRDHLDALSKVFSEQYDVNGNLKMVIDRNLGIYVTRQYRAFTEEGYLDKLLMVASGQESAGDAQMVEGYHRAHKYIESQFIRQFVRDKQSEERANNIPPNKRVAKLKLEEEGRIQLNSKAGQIQVREAITAYLQSLDTRYGSVNQVTKPAAGMTRAIFDQVRRRQDIPEPFRNLLGQYDESDVVNNVVRSIDAINRAASKQSFIKNLIQLGHQKDNPDAGFVFTQQELDTLRLEGKALPAPSMLNIRTGEAYAYKAEVAESIKDEVEQTYDIRAEYYIPSDAFTHIKNQFRPEPSVSSLSPDKQAVESAVSLVRSLTGISLAAKTLGSFGFYIRNVLGNALFFAPMNGMSPVTAMKSIKALRRSFRLSPTRMKEITDYEAKLIAHNVLGGDITVGLIRDIVDSDFDPDAANKELNGLFDKLKAVTKKAADSKTGQRIKSQILDRALLLSERVDAFYKIAYFEHEVKVYKKAVQWDKENGNVGDFASYNEYEIETEAAHNVRRTSQSYKDRYELVKGLSSKYGYLLAPFLGFKTDMLRITFDGVPKTIVRDIKSKNAVIRSRGYQRAVGLSTVAVGFGMVLPTALKMLYGIGEEEDENFRVTVPLYHKNATFLYYRDDEGTIIAYPFTFLLPVSDYAEPALRLTEHMMRGEFQEGLVKATGMFFSSYADDQIFAAAIKDAFVNKDDATGDPIYEEGDGFMIPAKIMRYIYENSFEPRTFKALRKAGMAAVGDEPTDPDKTAGAILAREFYPVRGNRVDPVRATSTYLNHYRNLRNRLDSKLNKAKTRGSMTKGELEKLTKDYVENRRAIDKKILSGLKSFEAFGLTPQMKRNVLNEKYLGIGKDRRANLARGLMRVPTLSSSFVEDMKSLGATGTERLRIMYEVLDRYPTLVTLEDD